MRGRFRDQGGLFSYLSPEARVPPRHPLRQIRQLVRAVLKDLGPSFGKLYASEGRPSIPAGAIAERLAASGVLLDPLGTPTDGAARRFHQFEGLIFLVTACRVGRRVARPKADTPQGRKYLRTPYGSFWNAFRPAALDRAFRPLPFWHLIYTYFSVEFRTAHQHQPLEANGIGSSRKAKRLCSMPAILASISCAESSPRGAM